MKPLLIRSLTLVLAMLTSACATPYQPRGLTGGFEEKKLAEGRFWLQFRGNGFTKPETVRQYWNKRAGELCGGRSYKENTSSGYDTKTSFIVLASGAYPTTDRFPVMQGTIECES